MLGALALIPLPVFSVSESSRSKLCEKNVNQSLRFSENRLSFKNGGGLANAGVCWWHSRFLRNASYLAFFFPNKGLPENRYIVTIKKRLGRKLPTRVRTPAPGSIMEILLKIKRGREIVEIPGFLNLYEFSTHFEREIQGVLEGWQREDGLIWQKWIVGLSGRTSIEPKKLQKIMDQAYAQVKQGRLVYQRLQLPGINSHAWLIQKHKKNFWWLRT